MGLYKNNKSAKSVLKLSAPFVIKDLSRSPISKHFVVKIARINFGIAHESPMVISVGTMLNTPKD